MKIKQAIKIIVILLLLVSSYILGRFWTGTKTALKDIMCTVYSDTQVRERLLGMHYVPEKSYKLYFSKYGFQDYETFIAFSASHIDCIKFLELHDIDINKMEKTSKKEEWITEFYPKKARPDVDHSNWDMSPDKEYLKSTSHGTIYFFDETINRVYVCDPT